MTLPSAVRISSWGFGSAATASVEQCTRQHATPSVSGSFNPIMVSSIVFLAGTCDCPDATATSEPQAQPACNLPPHKANKSTPFLQLHEVFHSQCVNRAAERSRHHHPQVDFLQSASVGSKADHDAPGLRPVLFQRRGHQRLVSVAEPQIYAIRVLEFAIWLELQLHPNVVGTGSLGADLHTQLLGPLPADLRDFPQGEARVGDEK